MKLPAFVGGVCVGLVAGAMMDTACPKAKLRRTTVGKAMEHLGCGMDSAWTCVRSKLH